MWEVPVSIGYRHFSHVEVFPPEISLLVRIQCSSDLQLCFRHSKNWRKHILKRHQYLLFICFKTIKLLNSHRKKNHPHMNRYSFPLFTHTALKLMVNGDIWSAVGSTQFGESNAQVALKLLFSPHSQRTFFWRKHIHIWDDSVHCSTTALKLKLYF